jgi:hypothetical protein
MPTKEELDILKRIREVAAGNAGPPGGMPYLQALAEIIPGHGPSKSPTAGAGGNGAPTTPGTRAAPTTPQGSATGSTGGATLGTKQEGNGGSTPQASGRPLVLGPARVDAQGGRKREADVDTAELKLRQDALAKGVGMEDIAGADCPAVPGNLSQQTIQAHTGAPFSQEEEEAWEASVAKGKEEEERAAGREAAGQSRSPERGGSQGRQQRSPPGERSGKKEDTSPQALAPEEAAERKVPSDGEEEDRRRQG